jgi:cytochrome c biogenesis factor
MYRYMKSTCMLAAPVLVYLTFYTVGVVVGNNVFNYVAVYMAACCAMLMLFFITRHNDDYKNALAALGLGACVFFASSYMVQALDQKSYPQPAYSETTAVLANATIQPWLASLVSDTQPSDSKPPVVPTPDDAEPLTQ